MASIGSGSQSNFAEAFGSAWGDPGLSGSFKVNDSPTRGRFRLSRISNREKADFCLQLAVLLNARVSIDQSLEVLAAQTRNLHFRTVIEGISREVKRGTPFWRALSSQRGVFDKLFLSTAEIGEETGKLPEILLQLAEYLDRISRLTQRFRQVLAYPVLVLTVAAGAVGFILFFIVPSFAEMFTTFRVELPASTRVTFAVSVFLREYGYLIASGAAVVLLISRRTIASEGFRVRLQSALLRVPLLGGGIQSVFVARFCRSLGTMLRARVPLLDALEVTSRSISEPKIRSEIKLMAGRARKGGRLSASQSGVFPPMVAQMVAVGEETSELDEMLLRLAEYYEKDVEMKVETLASIVEPVVVLVLGLVVGAILISMYLPLFDIVNLVGGY